MGEAKRVVDIAGAQTPRIELVDSRRGVAPAVPGLTKMQIYHRDCTWLPLWLRVLLRMKPTTARMIRRFSERDEVLSMRTYRCVGCGTSIHIDLDWEE